MIVLKIIGVYLYTCPSIKNDPRIINYSISISRNMRTDCSNKYVHCLHAMVEHLADSRRQIFGFPILS